MSGAEFSTWKVADLKAQLKAKVGVLRVKSEICDGSLTLLPTMKILTSLPV